MLHETENLCVGSEWKIRTVDSGLGPLFVVVGPAVVKSRALTANRFCSHVAPKVLQFGFGSITLTGI